MEAPARRAAPRARRASRTVGSPQIRNRGRSVATSAPPRRPGTRCRRCSWRRHVELASVRGERTLPLHELIGPEAERARRRRADPGRRRRSRRQPADVHEGRPAQRDGDRGRARLAVRGRRTRSARRSAPQARFRARRAPLARRGRLPRPRRGGREPDRRRARHRRLPPARAPGADAARAGAVLSYEDLAHASTGARTRRTSGRARASSSRCASGSACPARRTHASRANAGRARCCSTGSSCAPASCSPRRPRDTRSSRSRASRGTAGSIRVQEAFVAAGRGAVRLLHSRARRRRGRPAREERLSPRRRDPRGAVRQSLPLHRLREDLRRGPERRRHRSERHRCPASSS